MSPGRAATLATASGALLALAFPAPGLWPLAFVGHAPLLLALASASPLRGALLGWLCHAALNLVLFRFCWETLRVHGGRSAAEAAAALLLLSALQAGRGAALGLLTALGRRWLALPSAYVLASLLAGRVPVVFEWSLATALHDQRALTQAAALGGAPLVALLASTGGAAAAVLAARALKIEGFAWRWAAAALAPLAALALWGGRRAAQLEQRAAASEGLRVGLVHGAIALGDEASPAAGWPALLRAHRALEARGAELIVWPETAAPWALREGAIEAELGALLGAPLRVDALIGALIEGPGGASNRALLVREGRVEASYAKRALLPVGEAPAPWLRWLGPLLPERPALLAPPEGPPLRHRGRGLGLSICYEGVLGDRVRAEARRSGAALLINLTNDAWFGASEPELHLAATRLRAIELGRTLVRATNGGVTAVVGPAGRIELALRGGPTRPAEARAALLDGETPYARWGQAASWATGGALALWLAATPLWRRRQGAARRPAQEPGK